MERLNLTNLKAARRMAHLTAAQAAQKIGKKKSAIWKYENGITDISVNTLLQLLDAYGGVSMLSVFDAGSIGE